MKESVRAAALIVLRAALHWLLVPISALGWLLYRLCAPRTGRGVGPASFFGWCDANLCAGLDRLLGLDPPQPFLSRHELSGRRGEVDLLDW